MKKIFSIFALLLMAVTGAMAQTTYNVTLADGTEDAANWSVTPTSAAEDETVTIKYSGTKRVKSITAVKALTYPIALSAVTADYLGSVVTTDGNVYATVADATAASKTAVAMIAYVDGTSGLAIALYDESNGGYLNWATAKSTCEGKTPAVTNATWLLPSQDQWKAMFKANGNNEESYSGLNTAITTAKGSALREGGSYWSSSEVDDDFAWEVDPYEGVASWYAYSEDDDYLVRACLAFTCGGEAPTDVLSGVFSVSATKKVKFSRGNLQATTTDNGTTWTWAFAEHQWDCIGDAAANTSITGNGTVSPNGTVDLFGWSTSATHLGIHNSQNDNDYSGDFADWGAAAEVTATIGTGWFTLSKDEWTYLFNNTSRTDIRYCKATVNGKKGVVLFPDSYTHPTGVTRIESANTGNAAYNNTWTAENWAAMESAGAVFLPAAGDRSGASVGGVGDCGYYWSSTEGITSFAYALGFYSDYLSPAYFSSRYNGQSVRLVRVAE